MTRVLIGIPTLNGPSLVDRALASVKACTDLTDVTVLVSDDASTEENLKLNKDVVHKHGVEMLMSERRLGIASQWNRLVRHVPDAEVIALINDDVEVVDDWLDVLLFTLKHNPHVGMVGLRCETGVVKHEAPKRRRLDYYEARLMDGAGSVLSTGGACFAFRRSDWDAVGGFDERYVCFYEELDFGISQHERGMSCVIAEYPAVFHMGGATIAFNHDASALMLDSRTKFSSKWQASLDELRARFTRPSPRYVEWNSQWKNWRLP